LTEVEHVREALVVQVELLVQLWSPIILLPFCAEELAQIAVGQDWMASFIPFRLSVLLTSVRMARISACEASTGACGLNR